MIYCGHYKRRPTDWFQIWFHGGFAYLFKLQSKRSTFSLWVFCLLSSLHVTLQPSILLSEQTDPNQYLSAVHKMMLLILLKKGALKSELNDLRWCRPLVCLLSPSFSSLLFGTDTSSSSLISSSCISLCGHLLFSSFWSLRTLSFLASILFSLLLFLPLKSSNIPLRCSFLF